MLNYIFFIDMILILDFREKVYQLFKRIVPLKFAIF